MKKLLNVLPVIVFAAFICLSLTDASAQGVIQQVLKRMDEYNGRLTTLKADVTMVKVDAALGDDRTVTTGTMIYAKQQGKDALVRMDWKKPEESVAVVDGEYRMYRPRLEIAYKGMITDLNKSKSAANVPLVFSFMSTSKNDLSSRFEVALASDKAKLSSGVNTFHLLLTPKAKTKYRTAELWVDAHGAPQQIKVTEHNKDSTTILLTNSVPNTPLKKSDFIISWPNATAVKKL